jgi:hypothetical protein
VGALGVADWVRSLGAEAVVGGISWERRPIDPQPGPRRLDEVTGTEVLSECCALAGPEARVGAAGPRFAEGLMAGFLGEPVLLVDPGAGPSALARDLAAACAHLGCGAILLIDVGGDVLGHGDEAGLASPLCDAVLLAAAPGLAAAGLEVVAAVFGAGCDGELTPEEVLARIAEVAAGGGLLGAAGLSPAATERLERAVTVVPTEASAQAVACARGALGPASIRRGRRTVMRSPVGALTFFLDPAVTIATAARLAAAVTGASSLLDARRILGELGVRTELDLEEDAARGPAA